MKSLMLILLLSGGLLYGHSGGTDSQGGHYNRKTGEYHFHHGMGPHQHPGGVCPYSRSASRSISSKSFFERHPFLTLGAVGLAGYWAYGWWNANKAKR